VEQQGARRSGKTLLRAMPIKIEERKKGRKAG
jgi:hypothetical protein